jgi:hypothetical protein
MIFLPETDSERIFLFVFIYSTMQSFVDKYTCQKQLIKITFMTNPVETVPFRLVRADISFCTGVWR